METLLGIAGLATVGAITPGPNNVVVMREAARAGWAGALRASLGIVSGGLTLLLIAASGLGVLFDSEPLLVTVIAIACCLFLFGSGVGLLKETCDPRSTEERHTLSSFPSGPLGLWAFQFINPKAWSLVLTITSVAHSAGGVPTFLPYLALLFALISLSCLSLWAAAGLLITRWLKRVSVRVWLNRVTGAAFIGFALLLIAAVFRGGG